MMKRILLAGLGAAALGLATGPASAQWGPPGGGYGGGYGGGGYGRGYRDFDEDEDERPRYRRGPGYGYGEGYGRRRFGAICVTGRGNCATGRPVPSGSPCSCNIPGFGPKRGVVN
jgi:hypothetical protein